MAASAFNIYTAAKTSILNGGLNVATGTFVAILVSATYTPNLPTDSTYANVSANEVTGTGYTTGGVVLTGAALSLYLASVSIASGGTAYTQADVGKVITLTGGTFTTAATISITQVNGGTGTGPVTGISLLTGGTYSVDPANPASGTGSTAGSGLTINGIYGTQLFENNPSWSTATITAKYLVILNRAAGALVAGDKLLGYIDLNTASTSSTVSSTSGTFTVQFNSGSTGGTLFSLV